MGIADVFLNFIEEFSYLGIWIWFTFLDSFSPIPEEVVLLSVGYLSGIGIIRPYLALPLVLLGLMTSDSVFYFLSRRGSGFIDRFLHRLNQRKLHKFQKQMKHQMGGTLLLLTFIPKLRFFGPIVAGSVKLPFGRFLLYDVTALIIYSTLYFFLGLSFYSTLLLFASGFSTIHHVIFGAFIVLVVLSFLWYEKRLWESY